MPLRELRRVLLLVLLTSSLVLPVARVARADCASEESRFIHMTHTEYAYGSWNGIYVFDHDLAGCTYQDDFVATAHMQNTTGDKWVEVGYVENENGVGQPMDGVY
jgi:hypothetical protein